MGGEKCCCPPAHASHEVGFGVGWLLDTAVHLPMHLHEMGSGVWWVEGQVGKRSPQLSTSACIFMRWALAMGARAGGFCYLRLACPCPCMFKLGKWRERSYGLQCAGRIGPDELF